VICVTNKWSILTDLQGNPEDKIIEIQCCDTDTIDASINVLIDKKNLSTGHLTLHLGSISSVGFNIVLHISH
jgi:hypothetical protein